VRDVVVIGAGHIALIAALDDLDVETSPGPYELATGEHWDDIAQREGAKLIGAVDRAAPGFAGSVAVGGGGRSGTGRYPGIELRGMVRGRHRDDVGVAHAVLVDRLQHLGFPTRHTDMAGTPH
jgi:hypothetical protein